MDSQTLPKITPDAFNKTSGYTVPVWYRDVAELGGFPTCDAPMEVDVIVAGAGIAGLTTAYLLAKNGKSVALFEARQIGSGETGRTSAHLMSAVDDRYCEIERKFGKDTSRIVGESQCGSISLIESIIKDEKIDCDFERVDGYLFEEPSNPQGVVDRELTSAKEAGMKVEHSSVPFPQGAPKISGLKFGDQGQFHINKYIKGLAQACAKRGVKIFENSPATLPPTEDDNGCFVTVHGNKISAKKCVVCINYYWNIFKMEAYRTYCVAFTIPKGSVHKALYWNTEDPYVYARIQASPDPKTDYLIVGGEDHRVGQYTNYEERYNNLIKWTKDKFPVPATLVNKWSGQVSEPVDDLPYLGMQYGYKHTLMITGDSGTGMTNATIGAMVCTDKILEKENRWASTYDPARVATHDLTEFVRNGIEVAASYKNWITPGEVSDIEDIKPGCGAVMRSGLSKVACYRDDSGKLHSSSAVCPHYEAMLMWNESEKSFDCPAHGSRFNPYGKPIMSPSCQELSPVDPVTLGAK